MPNGWTERLDALLFAGRRIGEEGVVLLIAVRDDDAVDIR